MRLNFCPCRSQGLGLCLSDGGVQCCEVLSDDGHLQFEIIEQFLCSCNFILIFFGGPAKYVFFAGLKSEEVFVQGVC